MRSSWSGAGLVLLQDALDMRLTLRFAAKAHVSQLEEFAGDEQDFKLPCPVSQRRRIAKRYHRFQRCFLTPRPDSPDRIK